MAFDKEELKQLGGLFDKQHRTIIGEVKELLEEQRSLTVGETRTLIDDSRSLMVLDVRTILQPIREDLEFVKERLDQLFKTGSEDARTHLINSLVYPKWRFALQVTKSSSV